MQIKRVEQISMVAVNEVTYAERMQQTPIDFGQLLQSVIKKDKQEQDTVVDKTTERKETQNTPQTSNNILEDPLTSKKVRDTMGTYNPETVYDDIYEAASEKYGVSVSLLKAVSKVESDFTPTAVSKSGAIGLMQLMPATAKALGVTDAYDPEQNIMGGAKYLAASLDEFGDVRLALAAYNAGGGAVRNCGNEVPSYAQDYVDSVLKYYLS